MTGSIRVYFAGMTNVPMLSVWPLLVRAGAGCFNVKAKGKQEHDRKAGMSLPRCRSAPNGLDPASAMLQ